MKSLSVKLGVLIIGLMILGYAEVWGADWMFYGKTDKYSCFYDAKTVVSQR